MTDEVQKEYRDAFDGVALEVTKLLEVFRDEVSSLQGTALMVTSLRFVGGDAAVRTLVEGWGGNVMRYPILTAQRERVADAIRRLEAAARALP